MKAILINPFDQSITTIKVDHANDIKGMDTIHNLINCDCCDTFRPGELDLMLVDDRGHLKETQQAFFRWEGYGWPLAGKALLFGLDSPHGDLVDVRLTVEQVQGKITWLGIRQARH